MMQTATKFGEGEFRVVAAETLQTAVINAIGVQMMRGIQPTFDDALYNLDVVRALGNPAGLPPYFPTAYEVFIADKYNAAGTQVLRNRIARTALMTKVGL